MKKVTNCDIGGKGGLKFGICAVTAFLNGPNQCTINTIEHGLKSVFLRV